MKNFVINILIFINFIRCLPHLVVFYAHPQKKIIKSDIRVWLKNMKKNYNIPVGLIFLLGFHPEYRNLFYHRIGNLKYLLNIICRKMQTLNINTPEIGEGFFINHGYATEIGAKSIGKNCGVNQQVTIGDNYEGRPTILNNVTIYSGAILFGNITIGNNSRIGANATVFRDVPDNCTVFPAQSAIMKWKKSN